MSEYSPYRNILTYQAAKRKARLAAAAKPPAMVDTTGQVIDILRPPDDVFTYKDTDHVVFYYGATVSALPTLPLTTRFMTVSSPNPFVHEESELRPWRCLLFEIRLCHFRVNEPPSRGFAQIDQRPLAAWEIDYFEPLWRSICHP